MNYILHINAFWQQASNEKWMRPHHLSLYFALFLEWNKNRFKPRFRFNRKNVMENAKIGNKQTYYKCIRELAKGGFLEYYPSSRPAFPSEVVLKPLHKVVSNTSAAVAVPDPSGPVYSHPAGAHADPYNKQIKYTINGEVNGGPTMEQVVTFFLDQGYPKEEGIKFWYQHEGTGWYSGNTPIRNWQAIAHKWALFSKSPANEQQNHDYNEPF